MTTTDIRYTADVPVPARGDEVSFNLQPWWSDGWLIRATRGDAMVFTCVATRMAPDLWLIDECHPGRADHLLPTILTRAARYLTAEFGPAQVIAIHPAAWTSALLPEGAHPLHRMVPMGMLLDAEYLGFHHRPLPPGYRFEPLPATPADMDRLAGLSTDTHRALDRGTWQEALSGRCGPLITEASVAIATDAGLRGAVAVTHHRGTPLIGHCVTSATDRGRGLGRALLVEALLRAEAAGYTECRLNVVEDNWIAHRLYRSVGFTRRQPVLQVTRLAVQGAGHAQ